MEKVKLMKNKFLLLVSLAFLSLTTVGLKAQPANFNGLKVNDSKLSLNDIYVTYKYHTNYLGAPAWMKDSKSYTAIERNKEIGGTDIVKYDIKTGERSILVSAKKLVPGGFIITQKDKVQIDDVATAEVTGAAGAPVGSSKDFKAAGKQQPLRIRSFYWSKDNTKLLIYTNTRKVWRYDTRGDYWVLDMNTDELFQVGEGLEESRLMFAKFNDQGTKIAFTYYNNIYVEDLATKEIKPLTIDGDNVIINGTFDWVYEEELGQRDGFRWAPDGESIAYWQSNTEGTGVFKIIDNIDSIYSTIHNFPYPKVGTTNSAVKIGVVNVETAKTKWFDIPGDPRNHYLARMDFIPNSNEVMIQQLNRLQNTNRVWVCDAATMEISNILTDKDDAFLDCYDNIEWLDHDKYFTWTSEKDGWRHLYKVSRDGKNEQLITKGDFDVISIKCIDPK
ncbi:MAG: DPP IV N-terminal domain-containing protein, partial [Bacteroidales bacterium]